MELQRQKSAAKATTKSQADGAKPKSAKDPKGAVRGKSFAQGEAALKPGGAVDTSRAPKAGGPHCDPLQDDAIEYEFIYDAATNMGIKMPSVAEWAKMSDKDKANYRSLLDGPLTTDDRPDPDMVAKMYAEDGIEMAKQ